MYFEKGFIGLRALMTIVFAVIVLGGGAYYVMHQNTAPQTSTNYPDISTKQQTTTNTPNTNTNVTASTVKPASPTKASLAIKIDANSLTSSSLTPTITGTASGVTEVHFEVFGSDGARVAAAQASFNSTTRAWSFPINDSTKVQNSSGRPVELYHGSTYSIEVFSGPGDSTVLTRGILTITK